MNPNPNDTSISSTSHNNHQLLPDERLKLDEKLLIASVSLSASNGGNSNNQLTATAAASPTTTSPLTATNGLHSLGKYTDNETSGTRDSFFNDPLLAHLDSSPHVIRGAPKNDLSCSGSDCDISWICLLVCILALCFAIPLVYVIYIAEHPEKFNHTESGWRDRQQPNIHSTQRFWEKRKMEEKNEFCEIKWKSRKKRDYIFVRWPSIRCRIFNISNFIWNLHINSLFLISDEFMIFNNCDSVKKNYFIWKIQHGFKSQIRMKCLRCTNRKYIAYIVLYSI